MYGIYKDIVEAAEKALRSFDETEELIEYPEVQADKTYYLSVLAQYNKMRTLKSSLDGLKSALCEESDALALLKEATSYEERNAILQEISACKRTQTECADRLSDALGRSHLRERAFVRFMFSPRAAKIGEKFVCAIKDYMLAENGAIEREKYARGTDGQLKEVSFFVEAEDVVLRLSPLAGTHKVYAEGARAGELKFAVSPADRAPQIKDDDLRVDLFHSSGAGGQNVNKVETAVRVVYIPTGTMVVCQDERSQLKNKQRAIETLKSRVREEYETAGKQRIEADVRAQFEQKNTPISIDASHMTITDARLKGQTAFLIDDLASYISVLMTL